MYVKGKLQGNLRLQSDRDNWTFWGKKKKMRKEDHGTLKESEGTRFGDSRSKKYGRKSNVT